MSLGQFQTERSQFRPQPQPQIYQRQPYPASRANSPAPGSQLQPSFASLSHAQPAQFQPQFQPSPASMVSGYHNSASQSQQSTPGAFCSLLRHHPYALPGSGQGPYMWTPENSSDHVSTMPSRVSSQPPRAPPPHAPLPHAPLHQHPHACAPHTLLHQHPHAHARAQPHARLPPHATRPEPPLHAMRLELGINDDRDPHRGSDSVFSGEIPTAGVSDRNEPLPTGTAAQATPPAVIIPCFACDKTDVGARVNSVSAGWAAVAILCLRDHRAVRGCSKDAKLCTLSSVCRLPSHCQHRPLVASFPPHPRFVIAPPSVVIHSCGG